MSRIICWIIGHRWECERVTNSTMWKHTCNRCGEIEIVSNFVHGFYLY